MPAGYATARLGDLCQVIRGSSPRPKGDPRYFGGNIPWVLISDVTRTSGRFLTKTAETVTDAGKKLSCYVEPGQLIVTNSATIGLPIFMGIGGCIHDGFLTFPKIDKRLTLEWLYWYFLFSRKHLTRLAPEGTQKNLNIEIVEDIAIPLPRLSDQRRIAGRLDQADELVRTRRYALELSEAFLPATFRKLFGPRFTSGPFRTFGEVVKITGGGTPARERPEYYRGRIPWLTSKDMKGDYIWDTEEHITEQAIKESATNLVPAGSILVVVKSKVLMHRLPVAITRIPLCHGQDIKSIQCFEGLRPEFARFVLSFHEKRLLNLARGANTEGLTLPMLEELPVPTVSAAEQGHFVELAKRQETLRAVQREALRQAEHLFAALLDCAFNHR